MLVPQQDARALDQRDGELVEQVLRGAPLVHRRFSARRSHQRETRVRRWWQVVRDSPRCLPGVVGVAWACGLESWAAAAERRHL